jgi:hypothetical protein
MKEMAGKIDKLQRNCEVGVRSSQTARKQNEDETHGIKRRLRVGPEVSKRKKMHQVRSKGTVQDSCTPAFLWLLLMTFDS